ncbi:hypothetical protein C8Q76DRAFT_574568, partial [Earliella scabrosa]
EEIDVVCKVAHGRERVNRLEKEATFYNAQLVSLQGQAVPMVFGFFKGNTVRGFTAVLVMEDCGDPLVRPLWQYPLVFRCVADAFWLIHKAGIQHNNFSECNIVIMKQEEDGEYWPTIVDFGNAEEHQCGYTGTEIPIYCQMPPMDDFGCFELWNACRDANVWKPRYINWYGAVAPVEWATTPEELIAKAGW